MWSVSRDIKVNPEDISKITIQLFLVVHRQYNILRIIYYVHNILLLLFV